MDMGAGPIYAGHISWARTDGSGSYILRGLPEGLMEVWANGRGYIERPIAVQIDDATPFEGADFAMSRGTTISGRVTDVDTGLSHHHVEVRAENRAEDGGNTYAETDVDGRYRLRGVAPGSYAIEVEGNGLDYVKAYYNDRLEWDDADLVTVRDSTPVEGIDFHLKIGTTISGRVIDAESGLPIPNIQMDAGPIHGNHLSWARTDGSGRYILRGLPDGLMEVWANGRSYVEQAQPVRINQSTPFERADFVLRLGTTISGRVTDVDTGLPVSNVEIVAENLDRDGPSSDARADLDGRYTLEGVAPGSYVIRVEGEWSNNVRANYVREYYDDQLRWDEADLVNVDGTRPVVGIDFGVNRGATIAGRIIDAGTGLPIPNMEVDAGPMGGNGLAWARTDGNGQYVLRGIPDGVMEVWVRGQGYIEVGKTVTIIDGQDVTDLNF